MNFDQANQQYLHLRNQWQSGRLTQPQFEAAVNALQVKAADGSIWQLRAADGEWMRWNGANWELAHRPEASPKKNRSRKSTILISCGVAFVVMICLFLVVGGGGYYLISTGSLSYIQIMNIVGPGTGEISIVNLDDLDVGASLERLDTEDGSPASTGSETLAPLEIGGFGNIEKGRYRLELRATNGGECILEIVRGDEYQFVVVPEGIAVTRIGEVTQNADEVDMATSSLCRK